MGHGGHRVELMVDPGMDVAAARVAGRTRRRPATARADFAVALIVIFAPILLTAAVAVCRRGGSPGLLPAAEGRPRRVRLR